jgi:hypothetical protein
LEVEKISSTLDGSGVFGTSEILTFSCEIPKNEI